MRSHFFIAGAQRSGTTYLYQLLDKHPEIEMARPVRPEPKFFLLDHLYQQGVGYYEQVCFSDKKGAWLRGEKCTSYMESEKAALHISQCFPDARIIFLLRDPIFRAVSNYRYSVENGVETLSITEAFRQEEKRREDYEHDRFSVSPYAYLKRGRYIDYISVYLRYFARGKIKVVLYESLVASHATLSDIFTFLGVQSDFEPTGLGQTVNRSKQPKKMPATLPEDLERYLTSYFAESNAKLSEYFSLDLKEWH